MPVTASSSSSETVPIGPTFGQQHGEMKRILSNKSEEHSQMQYKKKFKVSESPVLIPLQNAKVREDHFNLLKEMRRCLGEFPTFEEMQEFILIRQQNGEFDLGHENVTGLNKNIQNSSLTDSKFPTQIDELKNMTVCSQLSPDETASKSGWTTDGDSDNDDSTDSESETNSQKEFEENLDKLELYLEHCYKIKLVNWLGEGNYGVVYKAINFEIGIETAIKVQPVNTKNFIEVNRNEVMTLREINGHPAFPKLYHSMQFGISFVTISELCGPSLNSLLPENYGISEENCRKIGWNLMNGLEYLKSKNILHRDLHDSNVLLSHDLSHVKIIDFGLAIFCGDPHIPRDFRYAPFASPEVNKMAQYSFIDDTTSIFFIILLARNHKNLFTHDNYEVMITKKENLLSGTFDFDHQHGSLTDFYTELIRQRQNADLDYIKLQDTLVNSHPAILPGTPLSFATIEGKKVLSPGK